MVIAEVKAVNLNIKCKRYVTPDTFKRVIEVFRNKFTCKLDIKFSDLYNPDTAVSVLTHYVAFVGTVAAVKNSEST